MKAVFDTNILIDYFAGHQAAAVAIEQCTDKLISRISWIEVMVGFDKAAEESVAREFLGTFRIIETRSDVAERAILVRRNSGMGNGRKLKLPDALILATAMVEHCRLITRNTKDFDAGSPDILVPYQVQPPSISLPEITDMLKDIVGPENKA